VQRYLKRLATFGKASTLRTHRVIMRRWVTFFGARPIAEWASVDLENYIAERRAASIAASTINGELAKLKAVLRAAVEDEIIERLPFKITMVPVVKKRSAHVFSRAEIEKLLDCADPRARALLLLASATGMRFGELRHLKWRDIDPASLRVHISEKPEVNWAPKTNQERMLFLPIEVVQQLTAYRSTLTPHNGDDDWVFQNKMRPGERWATSGSVYSSIQAAFKKAGLYRRGKLTHEIRRAVASTMLHNGTPIHVVRDVLGHSNIKQTAEYAFTNEEAMRDAATKGIL
jgi:integrase